MMLEVVRLALFQMTLFLRGRYSVGTRTWVDQYPRVTRSRGPSKSFLRPWRKTPRSLILTTLILSSTWTRIPFKSAASQVSNRNQGWQLAWAIFGWRASCLRWLVLYLLFWSSGVCHARECLQGSNAWLVPLFCLPSLSVSVCSSCCSRLSWPAASCHQVDCVSHGSLLTTLIRSFDKIAKVWCLAYGLLGCDSRVALEVP